MLGGSKVSDKLGVIANLLTNALRYTPRGRVLIGCRRVGDHLPLHASAAGKVMMAFGEPELLEVGLEHLSRLTDRTITSPSKLRTEVSRARENGYATTHGEAGSHNYGIAVPVMSLTGRCVAALGVVTLERPASVGAVVPVLRIAARSIARRIGTSIAN